MWGANYSGNCSGFDQLLYRRLDLYCLYRPHRRQACCHRTSAGLKICALSVGAGLPAMRTLKEAPNPTNAPYWCVDAKNRIVRVHFSPPTRRQMPANACFYPTLAIFGHWHAICSLVRQVSLADYPRPATPFFQGSGPPRSRPSGGQHVEVGSTHQRS